ncbi:MAG: CaiB/BaiF CoA transferase family protein [Planctomycetota bacterium]|jgi:crotonobetainyl-CoA:carnitine CoA-transferase CaiB-like acyl-CoA transferase
MNSSPLQGVRVVDLTHYWAGPTATRILADYGAQVIKIEYLRRLCVLRGGQKKDMAYNRFPRWHQVNRNKYSVILDLKSSHDRNIFRDLVKISDVVVDNFRGGSMERIGYDYDKLKELKPDIIQISMPAFGDSGPYRSYAGVGASMEALSGIQSYTVYDNDDRSKRIKEMDVVNGIMGTCAIMTALLYHQKTGRGQFVDLSQMEAGTHALIGEHLLEYEMTGQQRHPIGNRHLWHAPQGCYRCKGEDRWIAISVSSEEVWHKFCQVLGCPEWKKDPRFETRLARRENQEALDRLIENWTIQYDHIEAMSILQKAGVPAGAVLDMQEIVVDSHLKARNFFCTSEDGSPGFFIGMPFSISGDRGKMRWRGRDLGQDNTRVLTELLGRSADDISPISEDDIGTGFDPE